MDHTSLVWNVKEHKTYAMDPKALSEQNNNRKSLRTEILTLYGQDTVVLMMDHTSLVRNVEEHKTYAMDPKALSEQNNNRKSLRTERI